MAAVKVPPLQWLPECFCWQCAANDNGRPWPPAQPTHQCLFQLLCFELRPTSSWIPSSDMGHLGDSLLGGGSPLCLQKIWLLRTVRKAPNLNNYKRASPFLRWLGLCWFSWKMFLQFFVFVWTKHLTQSRWQTVFCHLNGVEMWKWFSVMGFWIRGLLIFPTSPILRVLVAHPCAFACAHPCACRWRAAAAGGQRGRRRPSSWRKRSTTDTHWQRLARQGKGSLKWRV